MSDFLAFINRMKLIKRWSLMRNTKEENVSEHSHQVAYIAHLLALIDNTIFKNNVDCNKVGMIALYHETSEVITGDLPTPIKYLNFEITAAFKKIEHDAAEKIVATLPNGLCESMHSIICPDADSYEFQLVKYADKLSALIKCMEELSTGNSEFKDAYVTVKKQVDNINCQAVQYFMREFTPSVSKTLDELKA